MEKPITCRQTRCGRATCALLSQPQTTVSCAALSHGHSQTRRAGGSLLHTTSLLGLGAGTPRDLPPGAFAAHASTPAPVPTRRTDETVSLGRPHVCDASPPARPPNAPALDPGQSPPEAATLPLVLAADAATTPVRQPAQTPQLLGSLGSETPASTGAASACVPSAVLADAPVGNGATVDATGAAGPPVGAWEGTGINTTAIETAEVMRGVCQCAEGILASNEPQQERCKRPEINPREPRSRANHRAMLKNNCLMKPIIPSRVVNKQRKAIISPAPEGSQPAIFFLFALTGTLRGMRLFVGGRLGRLRAVVGQPAPAAFVSVDEPDSSGPSSLAQASDPSRPQQSAVLRPRGSALLAAADAAVAAAIAEPPTPSSPSSDLAGSPPLPAPSSINAEGTTPTAAAAGTADAPAAHQFPVQSPPRATPGSEDIPSFSDRESPSPGGPRAAQVPGQPPPPVLSPPPAPPPNAPTAAQPASDSSTPSPDEGTLGGDASMGGWRTPPPPPPRRGPTALPVLGLGISPAYKRRRAPGRPRALREQGHSGGEGAADPSADGGGVGDDARGPSSGASSPFDHGSTSDRPHTAHACIAGAAAVRGAPSGEACPRSTPTRSSYDDGGRDGWSIGPSTMGKRSTPTLPTADAGSPGLLPPPAPTHSAVAAAAAAAQGRNLKGSPPTTAAAEAPEQVAAGPQRVTDTPQAPPKKGLLQPHRPMLAFPPVTVSIMSGHETIT